jgi:hypothetical protein
MYSSDGCIDQPNLMVGPNAGIAGDYGKPTFDESTRGDRATMRTTVPMEALRLGSRATSMLFRRLDSRFADSIPIWRQATKRKWLSVGPSIWRVRCRNTLKHRGQELRKEKIRS